MKQKETTKNQEKTKKGLYFGFLQGLDKNNKKEYNSIRNLSSLYRRKLRAWLRYFFVFLQSARLPRRKGIIMELFSMFRFSATAGGADNRRGRFATTLLAFIFAVFLTACGGGGGGSGGGSTTPTPTPTPTPIDGAATVATSPADGASAVKRDAVVTITPKVTAGTFAATTTTGGIVCNGITIVAPDKGVLDQATKAFTLTPSATLLPGYEQTCTVNYTVTVNGSDGGKQTVINGKLTYTTEKEPAWWPPKFVPQGTKVYLDSKTAPAGAVTNATYPGQTESGLLPPECKITGDTCWHEAVRNGTIKFMETPARDLLQPNRPIVWGFYMVDSPAFKFRVYCSKPFFADDGTLVNNNETVDNFCSSWQIFYFVTNEKGGIHKDSNPIFNKIECYQRAYNEKLIGWDTTLLASCPD